MFTTSHAWWGKRCFGEYGLNKAACPFYEPNLSAYHLSSLQKNSSSQSSLEVLQGSLMVFVTCVRVVEIEEGRKAETINSELGL
jgi:hypothetical protein